MTRRQRTNAQPTFPEMDKITKHYGKEYGGTVIKSGRQPIRYSHIPSGSFDFDVVTLGGWIDGLVNLAWGWQGCSKTTMAAKAIAAAQQKYPDKLAVYNDPETHYDPDWFELHGVDLDRLTVVQDVGFAEGYADVMSSMANDAEISIQVLDSIAALVPSSTLNKSIEDAETIAARAKVVNRLCSELISARQNRMRSGLHCPTTLLLNQYRDNPGMFGGSTALPGGRQQHFASYLSVEFKKPKVKYVEVPGFVKKDGAVPQTPYSNEHVFQLHKAKAGRLADTGKFELVLHNDHPTCNKGGIDDYRRVMAYAKAYGLVDNRSKQAQRFSIFPDMTFAPANGTEAASFMAAALKENPDRYALLKCILVAMTRIRVGRPMLPVDGYLLGFRGDVVANAVQETVEFVRAKNG